MHSASDCFKIQGIEDHDDPTIYLGFAGVRWNHRVMLRQNPLFPALEEISKFSLCSLADL